MHGNLAREMYEWRRMPVPTERFRNGDRAAATYALECEIDHLKSYVDSLLGGWGEKREWDYASIIRSRIADVERAKQLLARSGLGALEAEPHSAYLAATRSLLDHLASAMGGEGTPSG